MTGVTAIRSRSSVPPPEGFLNAVTMANLATRHTSVTSFAPQDNAGVIHDHRGRGIALPDGPPGLGPNETGWSAALTPVAPRAPTGPGWRCGPEEVRRLSSARPCRPRAGRDQQGDAFG